jgi:hypothetical protein
MRTLIISIFAAALALAPIPDAKAQVDLYSGCNAGFRACWDVGYYLDAETARRHWARCAAVSNGCQHQVRLAASGADYLDSALYPRLSGYVYIARTGQSTLIMRRGR